MIHKTLGHSLTSYHSTTDCLIHAIHAIQKLGMKQLPASQASQADLPPVRNDKSHDFSQLPKKKARLVAFNVSRARGTCGTCGTSVKLTPPTVGSTRLKQISRFYPTRKGKDIPDLMLYITIS